MSKPFNELDFRVNKEEKENKKVDQDDKNVEASVDQDEKNDKKNDVSSLTDSAKQKNKKKTGGKKSGVVTGLGSFGNFPPQRDFYAYFYDISMSVLLLLSAGAFFFLFRQSVNGGFNGVWTWLVPLITISIFVTVLLVYAITVHVKRILIVSVLLSFLISLLFAFSIYHFLVIILCFGVSYFTVHQMRKALLESVKINIGNLTKLGVGGIIFSVIFVMCSQYYWMVYDRGFLDLMPRFDRVSISEKVLHKFLKSKDDGEDSEIDASKVTVDEFLLMSIKSKEGEQNEFENGENLEEGNSQESESAFDSFLGNIGVDKDKIKEGFDDKVEGAKDASAEKVNEVAVTAMRKNLSKQLDRELNGDEYIADVFDEMMYNKIAGWFSNDEEETKKEEKKLSYLALILTLLLFVSALTLRMPLKPIIFVMTVGLFWVMRKIGIIKVVKVRRETEMIISQGSV